jgi:hypothetical protein
LFAVILLGVFVPSVVLPVFLAIVEYYMHHFVRNGLKIAYYSVIFLQTTSKWRRERGKKDRERERRGREE